MLFLIETGVYGSSILLTIELARLEIMMTSQQVIMTSSFVYFKKRGERLKYQWLYFLFTYSHVVSF